MFEILPANDDNNILAFKVSDKLTDVDYKEFLPVYYCQLISHLILILLHSEHYI